MQVCTIINDDHFIQMYLDPVVQKIDNAIY